MSKSPAMIWSEALEAAKAAHDAAVPRPCVFVVSGGGRPAESFYESEGACGFAWVDIYPARGPMVSYLKKAGAGRTKNYGGGGFQVWMGKYFQTQSVARLSAAADAAAAVLKANGVNAYSGSRLD